MIKRRLPCALCFYTSSSHNSFITSTVIVLFAGTESGEGWRRWTNNSSNHSPSLVWLMYAREITVLRIYVAWVDSQFLYYWLFWMVAEIHFLMLINRINICHVCSRAYLPTYLYTHPLLTYYQPVFLYNYLPISHMHAYINALSENVYWKDKHRVIQICGHNHIQTSSSLKCSSIFSHKYCFLNLLQC